MTTVDVKELMANYPGEHR